MHPEGFYFNYFNFFGGHVFFVRPPIPLFRTSVVVCPGFQSQSLHVTGWLQPILSMAQLNHVTSLLFS